MALNRSDKSRILRRYFPGMNRNSEMSTEPRKLSSTGKPRDPIFKLKARNSALASGQMLQTCAIPRSAFVSGVPSLLTRLKISTTWSTLNSSPET